MSSTNKKLLYIAKKPVYIFFIPLAAVWFIPAVKLFIEGHIISGIKLLLFGFGFMCVLYAAQVYFRKMLMLYQSNLDKTVKKNKLKKNIREENY